MIGMRVTTRTGAVLTAIKLDHKKRSRSYFVWECSTCSADTELWPLGQIVTCKYDVKKYVPCGCSGSPAYSPEQMYIRAKRYARTINAKFLGWDSDYVGNSTKCVLLCDQHGEWRTCGFNDLKRGRACPGCAVARRASAKLLNEKYYVDRLAETFNEKDWAIHARLGNFIGANTRIEVLCAKHGIFTGTYHHLFRGAHRCTGCSLYGYSLVKPADLYCLKSECSGYIKVGVTGNLPLRIKQLSAKTPFKFTVEAVWGASGKSAREEEKRFHLLFDSAGLKGFEGCTEWLKADPAIHQRFSLLPGAQPMPG